MQTRFRLAFLALTFGGLVTTSAFTNPFDGIVAFGDSLSDLGNTVTEFDNLDLGGVLYNETGYNNDFYDVGRWSNGPVWVENLNNALGLPTLASNDGSGDDIFGTNYAWGGSLSGVRTTDYGFVKNLQTQISDYLTILNADPTGQPDPANTLFTVWSGGNDVIDLVLYGDAVTPQQVATNIGTAITSLYNAGGRYFLVPNLPPLGDKPNFLNTPNEAPANNFVQAYNPLLATELDNLEAQFSDITIIRLDVFSLFDAVLSNPANFGFANVTQSAYVWDENAPNGGYVNPNPDSYLFWDGTHPTLTGHQLIGDLAYNAVVAAVPEPSALALLALTGGVLASRLLRRRRA